MALAINFSSSTHSIPSQILVQWFTEKAWYPYVVIRPIDSKKAFIEFEFRQNLPYDERRPPRKGRFLDLKTLVFALTNESHSLKSACELFKAEVIKEEPEGHGKVTPEYVDYNLTDVISTWELYRKVIAEYRKHPIELEPGKAYSPASIGKAYFRAMGVKPLAEKQPDFPQEILGYAMQAYYGGRAECHIRRLATKVFHVDVTSMYPSVFILQDLWSWVIAERFKVVEATEEGRSYRRSKKVYRKRNPGGPLQEGNLAQGPGSSAGSSQ